MHNDLQDLSLAGNFITELPEGIGRLKNLQRLQMSGNLLERLPDSICNCTVLQVHSQTQTCPQVAFTRPYAYSPGPAYLHAHNTSIQAGYFCFVLS